MRKNIYIVFLCCFFLLTTSCARSSTQHKTWNVISQEMLSDTSTVILTSMATDGKNNVYLAYNIGGIFNNIANYINVDMYNGKIITNFYHLTPESYCNVPSYKIGAAYLNFVESKLIITYTCRNNKNFGELLQTYCSDSSNCSKPVLVSNTLVSSRYFINYPFRTAYDSLGNLYTFFYESTVSGSIAVRGYGNYVSDPTVVIPLFKPQVIESTSLTNNANLINSISV